MSDNILMTLNNRLMGIGNRMTSFGGLSIIFTGDFCQLEPICLKESDLMFLSLSSMFWQRIINAIIFLDNDHHFKEDPEHGKFLKRLWEGDLTRQDIERISTRVIGQDGPELPSVLKGKHQIILFKNNVFSNSNFVLIACTIYVKVTLAMLVQEIKNIIISRHSSLRSTYKQHIHQLIATKIRLNTQ